MIVGRSVALHVSWGKCADQILHMHNVIEMTTRLSLHLLPNILQFRDEIVNVGLG